MNKYELGETITDCDSLMKLLKEDKRVHIRRLNKTKLVRHLVKNPFSSVMSLIEAGDLREVLDLNKDENEHSDSSDD